MKLHESRLSVTFNVPHVFSCSSLGLFSAMTERLDAAERELKRVRGR